MFSRLPGELSGDVFQQLSLFVCTCLVSSAWSVFQRHVTRHSSKIAEPTGNSNFGIVAEVNVVSRTTELHENATADSSVSSAGGHEPPRTCCAGSLPAHHGRTTFMLQAALQAVRKAGPHGCSKPPRQPKALVKGSSGLGGKVGSQESCRWVDVDQAPRPLRGFAGIVAGWGELP